MHQPTIDDMAKVAEAVSKVGVTANQAANNLAEAFALISDNPFWKAKRRAMDLKQLLEEVESDNEP